MSFSQNEPMMVITKLPDLDVDIQSSENLAFTDADEVPTGAGLQTQLHNLAAKTIEERNKFCKGRPWWECSEQSTQNECSFVAGQCKGAPVEIEPERYYQKWLRIYRPIYENMKQPQINSSGNLVRTTPTVVIPPRRKRSIRRERVMV